MGTTLNISEKTKQRFDNSLFRYAAVKGKRASVDEFITVLLDRWEDQ